MLQLEYPCACLIQTERRLCCIDKESDSMVSSCLNTDAPAYFNATLILGCCTSCISLPMNQYICCSLNSRAPAYFKQSVSRATLQRNQPLCYMLLLEFPCASLFQCNFCIRRLHQLQLLYWEVAPDATSISGSCARCNFYIRKLHQMQPPY